ncbi:MAG: aldolase/citrate lyase family protein [Pseudomonadota bacterium]
MGFADHRARMLSGERLAGTFLKTPALELVEVLAGCGLDFICLDAEHSAFDRARMDACLAMARALDFPTLVRVPSASPENILMALDSGAVGVVCPHIDSADKARQAAKAARFGKGGRGFAGSTRWAGYTRSPMEAVLEKSRDETVVLVQIEEPEGVDAAREIATVPGVDGLFIGPADLSISYGQTALGSEIVWSAFERVGTATKEAGKAFVSFAATPQAATAYLKYGVTVFYIGSEHGFIASGARQVATEVNALE